MSANFGWREAGGVFAAAKLKLIRFHFPVCSLPFVGSFITRVSIAGRLNELNLLNGLNELNGLIGVMGVGLARLSASEIRKRKKQDRVSQYKPRSVWIGPRKIGDSNILSIDHLP